MNKQDIYTWSPERFKDLRVKCNLLMGSFVPVVPYSVMEIIANLKDALDTINILQDEVVRLQDRLDLKEL